MEFSRLQSVHIWVTETKWIGPYQYKSLERYVAGFWHSCQFPWLHMQMDDKSISLRYVKN